jgi:hypothetical protein
MLCEKHMVDALAVADRLIELSRRGGTECGHDPCLLVDSVLCDCAMRIRRVVKECESRLSLEPDRVAAGISSHADRRAAHDCGQFAVDLVATDGRRP